MPSCLGFYCIKITSLLNKLKALLFSVPKKVHMFLSTYFLNTDSKCTTVGQVKSGLPSMIISSSLPSISVHENEAGNYKNIVP